MTQLIVFGAIAVLMVGFAIYAMSGGNRRKDESESNRDYTGGPPADGGGD
jgi:hypothetical protein